MNNNIIVKNSFEKEYLNQFFVEGVKNHVLKWYCLRSSFPDWEWAWQASLRSCAVVWGRGPTVTTPTSTPPAAHAPE